MLIWMPVSELNCDLECIPNDKHIALPKHVCKPVIEDRGDTGRHQRNTDGMPTEQGKLKNNIFT
jgi:hypothetical protein